VILAYLYHHDMGAGWWVLMTGGMIIFWGLVIWAVISVLRNRGTANAATPRELLDSRLARGEISIEEYRRLREALDPAGGPTPAHP
jgi:putative membrane protein